MPLYIGRLAQKCMVGQTIEMCLAHTCQRWRNRGARRAPATAFGKDYHILPPFFKRNFKVPLQYLSTSTIPACSLFSVLCGVLSAAMLCSSYVCSFLHSKTIVCTLLYLSIVHHFEQEIGICSQISFTKIFQIFNILFYTAKYQHLIRCGAKNYHRDFYA